MQAGQIKKKNVVIEMQKIFKIAKILIMSCIIMVLLPLTAYCAEINVAYSPVSDVTKITFETPDSVPDSWIPLRKASDYLPINVSWDADARNIIIDSEANQTHEEISIDSVGTENKDLKIVNGSTYCIPQFLSARILGYSFVYNDELWYCDTTFDFDGRVRSTMLELKIVLPREYAFITEHLTGGIEQSARADEYAWNVLAYVYPHWERPVCYIIRTSLYGEVLAAVIAHEAWHVYEVRNGTDTGEFGAELYETIVLNLLRQKAQTGYRSSESDETLNIGVPHDTLSGIDWFDSTCCPYCDSVAAFVLYLNGQPECAWCEQNGYCKFFQKSNEMPSGTDIVTMWLKER